MTFPSKLIFATAMIATPATAELGVEFSKMPVGCAWTVEYSNGNRWLETYVGTKKGLYIVDAVEADQPGKKVKQTHYNSEGLMVYRNWPGKGWEKFTPYSCFGLPGSCEFKFENADGMSVQIYNKTVQKGGTFIVTSGIIGGSSYPVERFKLGPFNLKLSNSSSNYSAKLTSLTNCGIGS